MRPPLVIGVAGGSDRVGVVGRAVVGRFVDGPVDGASDVSATLDSDTVIGSSTTSLRASVPPPVIFLNANKPTKASSSTRATRPPRDRSS